MKDNGNCSKKELSPLFPNFQAIVVWACLISLIFSSYDYDVVVVLTGSFMEAIVDK